MENRVCWRCNRLCLWSPIAWDRFRFCSRSSLLSLDKISLMRTILMGTLVSFLKTSFFSYVCQILGLIWSSVSRSCPALCDLHLDNTAILPSHDDCRKILFNDKIFTIPRWRKLYELLSPRFSSDPFSWFWFPLGWYGRTCASFSPGFLANWHQFCIQKDQRATGNTYVAINPMRNRSCFAINLLV